MILPVEMAAHLEWHKRKLFSCMGCDLPPNEGDGDESQWLNLSMFQTLEEAVQHVKSRHKVMYEELAKAMVRHPVEEELGKYICVFCQESFYEVEPLRRHFQNFHHMSLMGKFYQHSCRICPTVTFNSEEHLRAHIVKEHGQRRASSSPEIKIAAKMPKKRPRLRDDDDRKRVKRRKKKAKEETHDKGQSSSSSPSPPAKRRVSENQVHVTRRDREVPEEDLFARRTREETDGFNSPSEPRNVVEESNGLQPQLRLIDDPPSRPRIGSESRPTSGISFYDDLDRKERCQTADHAERDERGRNPAHDGVLSGQYEDWTNDREEEQDRFYDCDLCEMSFSNRRKCANHFRSRSHWAKSSHFRRCDKCLKFKISGDIKDHVQREHWMDGFACAVPMCKNRNPRFSEVKALRSHLRKAHECDQAHSNEVLAVLGKISVPRKLYLLKCRLCPFQVSQKASFAIFIVIFSAFHRRSRQSVRSSLLGTRVK